MVTGQSKATGLMRINIMIIQSDVPLQKSRFRFVAPQLDVFVVVRVFIHLTTSLSSFRIIES